MSLVRSAAAWGVAAAALLLCVCAPAVEAMTVRDAAGAPVWSPDAPLSAQFELFKQLYNKTYGSALYEQLRRHHFGENLRRMADVQSRNPHATFSVNRFFDLSLDEFHRQLANGGAFYAEAAKKRTSLPAVTAEQLFANERRGWLFRARSAPFRSRADIPDRVDWREEGFVTPVKDQGNCGACWAFSAVGNIESMWAKAGHDLVRLSEQQLVSCDNVDDGCNGGDIDSAYQWLIDSNKGAIYTEESYPYVSGSGARPECSKGPHDIGAVISGYLMVTDDEDVIAAYLSRHGPLAIAVDANALMYYSGGVVTDCHGVELNHAVLLVGYNSAASPPYWIIKNSWGTDWGEEGYVRIQKDTNECRMADFVITARVAEDPTPTSPEPTPEPTPEPGKKTAMEARCRTARCGDCDITEYPTDVCMDAGGGSFMVRCGARHGVARLYDGPGCTGPVENSVVELDSCVTLGDGSWLATCG